MYVSTRHRRPRSVLALVRIADEHVLTFAPRERTPLDLAHELVASAPVCEAFRLGLAPARLRSENLGGTLNEVREMVTSYLGGLDLGQQADRVATQLTSKS